MSIPESLQRKNSQNVRKVAELLKNKYEYSEVCAYFSRYPFEGVIQSKPMSIDDDKDKAGYSVQIDIRGYQDEETGNKFIALCKRFKKGGEHIEYALSHNKSEAIRQCEEVILENFILDVNSFIT